MDVNIHGSDSSAASGDLGFDPSQFVERPLPNVRGRRAGEFQVVIRQGGQGGSLGEGMSGREGDKETRRQGDKESGKEEEGEWIHASRATHHEPGVLDEIHAHGQSRLDAEVCGVLVGMPCRDEQGAYLHVEACIRGENAASASANVTFTAQTWEHIQAVMDEQYPDQKIVGWYHTHPGFGIFLSEMDLFIHRSFFDLPWQVAFVYDPIGGDEGVFVWEAGKPVRKAFVVQGGKEAVATSGDEKGKGMGLWGWLMVLMLLGLGLAGVVYGLWMLYWLGR